MPPRFVLGGGLLLIGAGGLLMTFVDANSTWRVLVAGLAVLGAGVGMANPTLASAALAAVPRERSGMASGAVNTARQFGFAVGVAALGTVFTTAAATALRTAGAHDPAGLASALSAGQAPKILAAADPAARGRLADVLASGYADGLRDVFLACGIAGIVGGPARAVARPRGCADELRGPPCAACGARTRSALIRAAADCRSCRRSPCPTTGSAPWSSPPTPTTSSTASRPPSPLDRGRQGGPLPAGHPRRGGDGGGSAGEGRAAARGRRSGRRPPSSA